MPERTYPARHDQLYAATTEAVTKLGFPVLDAEPQHETVTFNTGWSWRSWHGHDVVALVEAGDDDTSTLVLECRPAAGQLFARTEAKAIATTVFEAVAACLPRRSERPTTTS